MRWIGLCLLVSGCMTDSSGSVCADSPPWLSEGPTECPGSSGASGATYHSYSDPTAIKTFGGVRIAMRSSDPAVDEIEIRTLELETSRVSFPEVLVGPSGAPQLVGDDTGAYLVWTDREHQSFGATLDANNALGEVFEFGKLVVRPLAVRDRFLAVETDYGRGLQQARWVEATGAVGTPFDFPGALSGRGMLAAGGGVAATLFNRESTISVARTNGPEIELAEGAGASSLAILSDGTILATYTKALTPTAYPDLHLVRIELDGATTDRIVRLELGPQLVVAGDRVFGLVRSGYSPLVYRAYEIDAEGAILRDKIKILELDDNQEVLTVPYQRDLVVLTTRSTIEAVHFDGAPGPPVLIAESYEIDDGCNAGGGSAGFVIVVAFAGLRRRRRR